MAHVQKRIGFSDHANSTQAASINEFHFVLFKTQKRNCGCTIPTSCEDTVDSQDYYYASNLQKELQIADHDEGIGRLHRFEHCAKRLGSAKGELCSQR